MAKAALAPTPGVGNMRKVPIRKNFGNVRAAGNVSSLISISSENPKSADASVIAETAKFSGTLNVRGPFGNMRFSDHSRVPL